MTDNESRYTGKDLNMPQCSIICTFLILFSIKFRILYLYADPYIKFDVVYGHAVGLLPRENSIPNRGYLRINEELKLRERGK
jgi:hypothetical protein